MPTAVARPHTHKRRQAFPRLDATDNDGADADAQPDFFFASERDDFLNSKVDVGDFGLTTKILIGVSLALFIWLVVSLIVL